MRRKVFLSLAVVVLLTVSFAAGGLLTRLSLADPGGSVPQVINYQGTLLNQSTGSPVPDGSYTILFSLYDVDTGGSSLWQETQIVSVNDGLFSVLLGSNISLDASLFDDIPRYLGVKVEADDEMTPRQLLASVPYALQAEHAKTASHAEQAETADSAKQLIQDFVVASGESVTAGDVVTFINGYVRKGFSTITYGSEYVFNSANTDYFISAAVLSDTKFVVAYKEEGNSDYGTAVIGEVSGNTIAYGSEYVFNPADTYYISAAALSDTKFVVTYEDDGNSDYGMAVIGDVSGTTITCGPEYVFNPDWTDWTSAAALSDTKFVVAYRDWGNSQYGTAVIGDVSGTTISYGSECVFNPGETRYASAAALSDTKFVVAYRDEFNSQYGTAIIGDVSGSTISCGSEHVFNPAFTYYISAAALSGTKFVVAYTDYGNFNYGTAVIGGVSGTTITYGAEYVFNTAATGYISAAALSGTKFVVAYRDVGNSWYGTALIGDVSGSTISCGSEYVFNPAGTSYTSAAALSDTKFVVAYCDGGSSSYGTAVIGDVTVNGMDWMLVGTARESMAAGQTVPVIIGGVSDVHSGLIPGEVYYSTLFGDLTTSATNYRIGLAISATELLLGIDRETAPL